MILLNKIAFTVDVFNDLSKRFDLSTDGTEIRCGLRCHFFELIDARNAEGIALSAIGSPESMINKESEAIELKAQSLQLAAKFSDHRSESPGKRIVSVGT